MRYGLLTQCAVQTSHARLLGNRSVRLSGLIVHRRTDQNRVDGRSGARAMDKPGKRMTPEVRAIPEEIDVVSLEQEGIGNIFATAGSGPSGGFRSTAAGLARVLRDLKAEVLELRVFAPPDLYLTCRQVLEQELGSGRWPILFVGAGRCPDPGIAGLQARAVVGTTVRTVRLGGKPLGRLYEDEGARYCFISDLQPSDASKPRAVQVRNVLEQLEDCLSQVGMDLRHVVRTWFFIDDILDWYADFNAARGAVYSERDLFRRYVPASTGIGHHGLDGRALAASALALEAKGGDISVAEVASPLQCSARDYGSSFSRAAEISTPAWRLLHVSGTASIDPDGRTVYAGDVDAQIARTLEVVGAILESRGLAFADVVRANAYFRHADGCATLREHLTRAGLPSSRVLVSNNAVCRDDLLFELEVDAVGTDGSARLVSLGRGPGTDA